MQYDNLVALYRSPVPKFFSRFYADNAEVFNMEDIDSRASTWSLKDTVLYNLFIFIDKFREYLAKTVLDPLFNPELEFSFDLEDCSTINSVIQGFGSIKTTVSDDYYEQFAPFYSESEAIPKFLTDKENGYWDIKATFNNYRFDEEWSSYYILFEEYENLDKDSKRDYSAIVTQEREEEFKHDIENFFCMFFGKEEAYRLSCRVLENPEQFKLFRFEKNKYPNKYYFDEDFLDELLQLAYHILEDDSSKSFPYRRSALQLMFPELTDKYGLENLFHILFSDKIDENTIPLSFLTWESDSYSYPYTGMSIQISNSAGFFLAHSVHKVLSMVPENEENLRQDIIDFYHFFLLTEAGFIKKECFCYFNLYNDFTHYLSTGLDGKNYYVTASLFTTYYGVAMNSDIYLDAPKNYNISALTLLSIADNLYQRLFDYLSN